MRKSTIAIGILAALMAFGTAAAYAADQTVTGELVDVTCHAKDAKNMGDSHAACAAKCAAKGAPLGILADKEVITLASNDVTGENSSKIVSLAGKKVEATGSIAEKDGKKTMTLTSIKEAK